MFCYNIYIIKELKQIKAEKTVSHFMESFLVLDFFFNSKKFLYFFKAQSKLDLANLLIIKLIVKTFLEI